MYKNFQNKCCETCEYYSGKRNINGRYVNFDNSFECAMKKNCFSYSKWVKWSAITLKEIEYQKERELREEQRAERKRQVQQEEQARIEEMNRIAQLKDTNYEQFLYERRKLQSKEAESLMRFSAVVFFISVIAGTILLLATSSNIVGLILGIACLVIAGISLIGFICGVVALKRIIKSVK